MIPDPQTSPHSLLSCAPLAAQAGFFLLNFHFLLFECLVTSRAGSYYFYPKEYFPLLLKHCLAARIQFFPHCSSPLEILQYIHSPALRWAGGRPGESPPALPKQINLIMFHCSETHY